MSSTVLLGAERPQGALLWIKKYTLWPAQPSPLNRESIFFERSSHDLCREIKMYWARRPITRDLFGKQSLPFGLGIAIGSFPQIISPKHSHKSPISQRWGIRTINRKVVCSAPVRSARTFLESSFTQWWTSRTADQEVVGSTPFRCARAFSDFSKSFLGVSRNTN